MMPVGQSEAQADQESFTQKEKAKVLLSEYDTLRAEILARTGNMYQLFGAAVAVLLWILTNSWGWSTLRVLAALIILGGGFSWLIDRDIRKAAGRLRQIEHDINRRVGEDLLIWESRWGGAVSGFFGPARPLSKEQAEDRLRNGPDYPWVGQLLMLGWKALTYIVVFPRRPLSVLWRAVLEIGENWQEKLKRLTKISE
jgi:hypothetical protein